MKKALIISIICCIVLIAGVYLIYNYYEKPKIEAETNYTSVYISAKYKGKNVLTGLMVKSLEGVNYYNISSGYEGIRIRNNQTITIQNINLENQTFYIEWKQEDINEENRRIDLLLSKPEIPTIKVTDGNPINLTLYSSNFQVYGFCLKWSLNYIFVEAQNYSELSVIPIDNYDRCYSKLESLEGEVKEIDISYEPYGIPTEFDYINFTIFDTEFNNKTVRIK